MTSIEEYKQEKFVNPVKVYWAKLRTEKTPAEISQMMRLRRLGKKKHVRKQD